MPTKRFYGCHRQQSDCRDYKFTPPAVVSLPPIASLRPLCPPVFDQGQLGSCTANGSAFAMEFMRMFERKKNAEHPLSRLQIYYNTRKMMGTINEDSGADIRTAIKATAQGACFETTWPYDISKFTKKPSAAAVKEGKAMESLTYQAVQQDLNHIKASLATNLPVVIGFTVFASFESEEVARTGIVPMPKSGEQQMGGHCVVIIGYNDTKQMFECRNSWGPGWGDAGYFWMPYAFLTNPNLASDFWNVTKVE